MEKITKKIVAIGGGCFTHESDNTLDQFFLDQCSKKKIKLGNIRQQVCIMFGVLFVDFEISNLSLKIQSKNNYCVLGYLNSSYDKCWLSAH